MPEVLNGDAEASSNASLVPVPTGELMVGRADLLPQLVDPGGSLTILAGDSGIGKTQLLRFAARSAVRSQVGEFRGTSGSLQRTLLDLLAAAFGAWQSERPATRRLAESARRVVERAAGATASQMGRLAGKALLSYLGTKIGPDAVELLKEVVAEVTAPDDGLLDQRIRSARDDDVIDAIVAMLNEVRALVGEFNFYIDNAERLTDDDFAALLDVGQRLPAGVRIVTALALIDSSDTQRCNRASGLGVGVLNVEQLDELSVSEWLRAAGLAGVDAAQIRHLTAGYPVFIDACVGLLKSGHELSSIEVSQSFRSITEQSWSELTDPAQAAAQLLLPFQDEPPVDLICAITGLDPTAWVVIENRLVSARIFCANGSGSFWFHDRRRAILWDSVLGASQRELLAERVLRAVSDFASSAGAWPDEALIPLAQLTPWARGFASQHKGMIEIASVGRSDLATLFAAAEVLEPKGGDPAFVETGLLLGYRRQVFPEIPEARESIERLMNLGLLHVASDDRSSVVTMTLGSAAAAASVEGRFMLELGRRPLARAASVIFELGFRPLMGKFSTAAIGIGRPVFSQEVPKYAAAEALLLVQARVGWRDFYAIVLFDSLDDRDFAYERLSTAAITVFEQSVEMELLYAYPGEPIPSQRFLAAMREVYDVRHGPLLQIPRLDPPGMPALEAAQRRLATNEYLRSQLGEVERLAGDCDQGLALFVDERDGHCVEVEVRTSEPRAGAAEIPEDLLNRPLGFFLMEEALGVAADEKIRSVVRRSSVSADPSVAELVRVARSTQRFNKRKKSYYLPSDEARLTTDLQSACTRLASDVASLGALRLGPSLRRLEKLRRRSLIWIYPHEVRRSARPQYFASVLRLPSPDFSCEVRFGQVPWDRSLDGIDEWLIASDIMNDPGDWSILDGWGSAVVAGLLGYADREVQLWSDSLKVYLGSPSAASALEESDE